jgi:hypothetical protein
MDAIHQPLRAAVFIALFSVFMASIVNRWIKLRSEEHLPIC